MVTGVLTHPSDTAVPRLSLTQLPVPSILEPVWSTLLQVKITLTPTKYLYWLISPTLDAYNRYVDAIGAVIDQGTGLLSITPAQYANLQSLFFVVGGNTYELIANAQIWPRTHNNVIGGKGDSIYLVVQDIEQASQSGMDFICGMTFIKRFYSVYDTGYYPQLGLATTQFTNAIVN
jgi:hypothetical protein